jgi:O-antigen ligase
MSRINNIIAASSVIIFPATVLGVDKSSGLIFGVVVLLGLWQMIFHYKDILPISKEEVIFFFSLSILLLVAITTTYITKADFARADRFIGLVLVIPVYMYFKQNLTNEKYVWFGVIIGAYIAFIIALYQSYEAGYQQRATGVVNGILFGNLSLIMGVMSLAGLGWFNKLKWWLLIFPILAFISGLLASALSLTRGGWLSLPFLILLFIWYISKRFSLRTNIISLGLVVVLVGGIYILPQTGVQKRIDTSLTNLHIYLDSENVNDAARSNSVGSRLEMWKAAWLIFVDHPIIGVGWGGYSQKAQELVNKGDINAIASKFYHPHNQYLSALAKSGLIGLIVIIIFYYLQAFVFSLCIRGSRQSEVHRLSLAGLILVVGFASFGLTEAVLERSKPVIFYAFYLAVFMALIQRSDQECTGKKLTS